MWTGPINSNSGIHFIDAAVNLLRDLFLNAREEINISQGNHAKRNLGRISFEVGLVTTFEVGLVYSYLKYFRQSKR